jgi:hypothetical protein
MGDAMKALLYLPFQTVPRHDRQIMALALAASTLLLVVVLGLEVVAASAAW